MAYSIDKGSSESIYMQLYTALRESIIGGAYPYGAKLPSKRQTALEAGVSVISVEHAYEILCDEGYVEARERSGYYSVYRESDMISSTTAENHTRIKNSESHFENDEIPFPTLARVMRRVLTEYGESMLMPSPNIGCEELRRSISEYLYRARGIAASPDCIVVGSGSEYLYSLTAQLLRDEGSFALEFPSYDKIKSVYEACGIECEQLKLDTDGIGSEELRRACSKVLHVTPFNSYPSMVCASASKRMEYIRWAVQRDGYIIEDDFDSEFSPLAKREDTLYSLDSEGRVIYMNTFTKTISPSIRVGYMILPRLLTERFSERLGFYSCTVPVFEQLVISELIGGGEFERHINRVRRIRRQRTSD